MRLLGIVFLAIILSSCAPFERALDLDNLRIFEEEPEEESPDFAVSETSQSLVLGEAQVWDGCDEDGRVQGGVNSSSQCGEAYLHPLFGIHLNTHFFPCVLAASERAGFQPPVKVFINHFQTYSQSDAEEQPPASLHAYARAIDIGLLVLTDSRGTAVQFSPRQQDYSAQNAVFYDELRQCWAGTMPQTCLNGEAEFRGSIGHAASQLGGDEEHSDRLHLSLPFCADN